MPETAYIRKSVTFSKALGENSAQKEKEIEGEEEDKKSSDSPSGPHTDVERKIGGFPTLMTYKESLRIFSGTYSTGDSVWMVLWRPFALLGSPTVLVSRRSQALNITLSSISIVLI